MTHKQQQVRSTQQQHDSPMQLPHQPALLVRTQPVDRIGVLLDEAQGLVGIALVDRLVVCDGRRRRAKLVVVHYCGHGLSASVTSCAMEERQTRLLINIIFIECGVQRSTGITCVHCRECDASCCAKHAMRPPAMDIGHWPFNWRVLSLAKNLVKS